jgi:hypothetical protein
LWQLLQAADTHKEQFSQQFDLLQGLRQVVNAIEVNELQLLQICQLPNDVYLCQILMTTEAQLLQPAAAAQLFKALRHPIWHAAPQ